MYKKLVHEIMDSFFFHDHDVVDNRAIVGKLDLCAHRRFRGPVPLFRYTFAVIDERAIEHNVSSIRRRLAPVTKLMIAVKANGYGHGGVQVVRAAIRGGADAFAVATIEEAIELRSAGIIHPILVLGAITPPGLLAAAKHDITVTYTESWGALENLAPMQKSLKVHIKVDTGMNRLGLRTKADILQIAEALSHRADIRLEGMYTHLACADVPDSPHTALQIERFDAIVDALKQSGFSIPCLHAANSGGALQDYQYNMVRVGISTYGYSPNPKFDFSFSFRPALHLYTMITRVASVKAGEAIGYGATYVAPKNMVIATLPIGYADGYPRILSSKGFVLIHGEKAPIVGRICMDQLMVDVTLIPNVKAGDAATIYGQEAPDEWIQAAFDGMDEKEQADFIVETFAMSRSGTHILSLNEIAELADTISYELMCAVSTRVPRFYVSEETESKSFDT